MSIVGSSEWRQYGCLIILAPGIASANQVAHATIAPGVSWINT